MRRVGLHLLPKFFAVALLCNLDRANLAFAAPQLNADLGFSKRVYGFGSGQPAALAARAVLSARPC